MKKYLLIGLIVLPTNFFADQEQNQQQQPAVQSHIAQPSQQPPAQILIQDPHTHDNDDKLLAAAFASILLNGANAITAKDKNTQINSAAAVIATIVGMFQLIRSAHPETRSLDSTLEALKKELEDILEDSAFLENL